MISKVLIAMDGSESLLKAYHDASFLPKQCDEIRDAVFKAIEDGLQHLLFYPFCLTENRQLSIIPMDDIPYAKLIPESSTGTKIEFDPIQLKTRLSVSLAHKTGRTLFPNSGSTIRNRLKMSKYNSSDYLRKIRAMICSSHILLWQGGTHGSKETSQPSIPPSWWCTTCCCWDSLFSNVNSTQYPSAHIQAHVTGLTATRRLRTWSVPRHRIAPDCLGI
jgi:hypothetical protein